MKKREKEKCRRGKRTLGQDWNNNHMRRMMGEWRALLAVDAVLMLSTKTDIMFCILKTASGGGSGGRASSNSSHKMYRHFFCSY